MKFKIGASGRVSALVAVAVVLIMVAVPFAAMDFNTEYSKGAPLATVSYDANGGTGNVPLESTFEIGLDASEVLFDPLPVRAGYVFIGWSTDEYATTAEYDFTTPYEDRFFVAEGDTTFYAVWKEIPSTSKFSLSTGPDYDREITWDGTQYQYRIQTGTSTWSTWTPLADNIIQFSGGTLSTGSIIFSLTGGVPFPDNYRLYLVFDNITVRNSSVTTSDGNVVNINPGAKVILQLVGDNSIYFQGGASRTNAAIRVADVGGMKSDLIITSQGNGSMTIWKSAAAGYSSSDPNIGSVIGGNGERSSAVGNAGETAGHIQIESGKLDLANKSTRLRGALIGGGGTRDGAYTGGDGGLFEMHGGSITTYQEATGASISAPAIGGGAAYNGVRSGHGGVISITGGSIDITQFCDDRTYGIRSAAIGGAACMDTKAGDSGSINISGGNIKITQTGGAASGSGIGAASAQSGSKPGQAIGTNETGGKNYIDISGGHIEIYQSNNSTTYGTLTGAGIGGGAGSQRSVPGGGADIRISGGYILVDRSSLATIPSGQAQGAAIGGGAEESRASEVVITGGNINIKTSITSATPVERAGAAIGCNLNADPNSFVLIKGGVINISRVQGTAEMKVPVGPNGDFGKAPLIDGGSIRLTGDQAFDTSGPNAPTDSQGHPLYRAKVILDDNDNPQSLFVKKANFIDQEFGTERYEDFHVQGRHVDLRGTGTYKYLNLYLPQVGEHTISLEVSSDGLVDLYTADYVNILPEGPDGKNTIKDEDIGILYRVVYRIGDDMRYEDDIVHLG
ncbi:MAG: InlB B-repeat-containing protein, partial [Methanomassiliicoccaceae archaeon]|nr:InlB B-repeat-containing protein [Methanomassiliicoccaceae archaeon]